MKIIKFKYSLMLILCGIFILPACDEDERLKEVPLEFYSPENSYVTKAHFQLAINNMYYRVRYIFYSSNQDTRYAYFYATDFAYNATNYKPADLGKLNDYKNVMIPSFNVVSNTWNEFYGIITDANVILTRIEAETSQVSEDDRPELVAEAKFFRAYAYKVLANLFGGVPLVLEEVTSPRRDYVRATREAVYRQCVEDLKDAAAGLPGVDQVVDGRVNKHIALHLLSEVYISLEEWDNAITAATEVIDYSGTGLMTTRFGGYTKDEQGDVYWDLFRQNNANRSTSNNTESLWVMQYDYQVGGSASDSWTWTIIPYYQTLALGGQTLFAGVTDKKCGRGVGWIRPTSHMLYDVWKGDFANNIRNSEHNIIRDLRIDNPNSPYFGQWMVADGINKDPSLDTVRNWFPLMTKVGLVADFPEDMYTGEKTVYGENLLINNANSSFKDRYLYRLAETYLLRAEAYIGKGQTDKAADDVNVIRDRANATPATAAEMNIDYILDERLRELYTEETRMFTLTRLGKLAERNKKYNPYTGNTIEDYHNLWPIPYSEIERNTLAVLEQNPGYAN